ncbi:MAG TPA: hypothetical protein VGL10_09580 [Gammaproteobacteria bacterium]
MTMNRTDTSIITPATEWTFHNPAAEYEDLSEDLSFEEESPLEADLSLYAYWSTEELHNLARELEIPNYQHINRETLIEMMIRRLF